MDDERPTQADLLNAWRDAARAAQLTERLAATVNKAAEDAEQDALASEEIADLAEGVNRDTGHAATRLASRQQRPAAWRPNTNRIRATTGLGSTKHRNPPSPPAKRAWGEPFASHVLDPN